MGDSIHDEYLFVEYGDEAQEAPIRVQQVRSREVRPGGAANVALNCCLAGHSVVLFTAIGDDCAGREIIECIRGSAVEIRNCDQSSGTTKKTRVLRNGKYISRYDYNAYSPVGLDDRHLHDLEIFASTASVIVVADYGKGMARTVEDVIRIGKKNGIPVCIDPYRGEYDKYYGATLIKPNAAEFQFIAEQLPADDYFAHEAFALIDRLGIESLLVTDAENGAFLFRDNNQMVRFKSQESIFVDALGAGDIVIGLIAANLALGRPLESACRLALDAAEKSVAKIGTTVGTQVIRRETIYE